MHDFAFARSLKLHRNPMLTGMKQKAAQSQAETLKLQRDNVAINCICRTRLHTSLFSCLQIFFRCETKSLITRFVITKDCTCASFFIPSLLKDTINGWHFLSQHVRLVFIKFCVYTRLEMKSSDETIFRAVLHICCRNKRSNES